MTEFVSEVKALPYNQIKVYEVLSNLQNLDKIKDKIPHDKVRDFSFSQDSCSFSIDPVGQIKFSIIEKDPPKTIKFGADKSPIEVNMWIQLVSSGEKETKMKLTVKANLNPFLKPMLSKPLQDGLNKAADVIALIPYDQFE